MMHINEGGILMKNVLTICLLLTMTLSACACSEADYPYYSNFESLLKESDIVVIGTISEVEKSKEIMVGSKNKTKNKYNVSTLLVDEVIKGDVEIDDSIDIKELSSEKTTKSIGYLSKNGTYLVFLEYYNEEVPCSLLNPFQGKIEIKNKKLEVDELNNIEELNEISDIDELIEVLNSIGSLDE